MALSRSDTTAPAEAVIDCAAASDVLPGQVASGDEYVVAPVAGGVLLAAIDGLGHGADAAAAAELCAATLYAGADADLPELLAHCHDRLRGTRGVVMSVARIDRSGTLTWLGVGNVEGVVLHTNRAEGNRAEPAGPDHLLLHPGVVGYQLPPLQTRSMRLTAGDVLILATDGVRTGFERKPIPGDRAEDIAQRLLAWYKRDTDDALVLVARYLGSR